MTAMNDEGVMNKGSNWGNKMVTMAIEKLRENGRKRNDRQNREISI